MPVSLRAVTVIALLGSGEFEAWVRPIEARCMEQAGSTSKRVLVLPTASAPEGEDVFDNWARMGLDHYQAMGLAPEVIPLRTRKDAARPDVVGAVAGAGHIFFSGGNPGYLAETVIGTPFWDAVLAAIADGTSIGGCSAGAVFLGTLAPYVSGIGVKRWVAGAGLLQRAYLMPHFDMLDSYAPNLRSIILAMRPAGSVVVGIDEDTALYGNDDAWTVGGSGGVWIGGDSSDELTEYRDGARVPVRLGLS